MPSFSDRTYPTLCHGWSPRTWCSIHVAIGIWYNSFRRYTPRFFRAFLQYALTAIVFCAGNVLQYLGNKWVDLLALSIEYDQSSYVRLRRLSITGELNSLLWRVGYTILSPSSVENYSGPVTCDITRGHYLQLALAGAQRGAYSRRSRWFLARLDLLCRFSAEWRR